MPVMYYSIHDIEALNPHFRSRLPSIVWKSNSKSLGTSPARRYVLNCWVYATFPFAMQHSVSRWNTALYLVLME